MLHVSPRLPGKAVRATLALSITVLLLMAEPAEAAPLPLPSSVAAPVTSTRVSDDEHDVEAAVNCPGDSPAFIAGLARGHLTAQGQRYARYVANEACEDAEDTQPSRDQTSGSNMISRTSRGVRCEPTDAALDL